MRARRRRAEDGPLHPRLPFSHDRETASERPVIAVGRDDHSRLRRDVVCDVDATRHPCPPVHRANGIEHLILDEVYSRRYLFARLLFTRPRPMARPGPGLEAGCAIWTKFVYPDPWHRSTR